MARQAAAAAGRGLLRDRGGDGRPHEMCIRDSCYGGALRAAVFELMEQLLHTVDFYQNVGKDDVAAWHCVFARVYGER